MKNLKESIEKERLFCLDILNKKFVHEGNSGCLTDRQVRLVLDSMQEALLIDRHVNLVSNSTQEALQNKNFNLTEEEMVDLIVDFVGFPHPHNEARGSIAKRFVQSLNK